MVESRFKKKVLHLTERKPQKLLNLSKTSNHNRQNSPSSPLDLSCENAPLDLSFQKALLDLSCPASNARRQYQPSYLAPDTLVDISKCLPSEVLHLIFAMLPFEDLNQVLLVCRRWREVNWGDTSALGRT